MLYSHFTHDPTHSAKSCRYRLPQDQPVRTAPEKNASASLTSGASGARSSGAGSAPVCWYAPRIKSNTNSLGLPVRLAKEDISQSVDSSFISDVRK